MTNYPPSDGVILPTCVVRHILELIWNIFNTRTWQIDCILWQFRALSRNIDTRSCYCTFYILSSQIFLDRNQVVYKYFAQPDSIWLSSPRTFSPQIHHAYMWKWGWRKIKPEGPPNVARNLKSPSLSIPWHLLSLGLPGLILRKQRELDVFAQMQCYVIEKPLVLVGCHRNQQVIE